MATTKKGAAATVTSPKHKLHTNSTYVRDAICFNVCGLGVGAAAAWSSPILLLLMVQKPVSSDVCFLMSNHTLDRSVLRSCVLLCSFHSKSIE